MGIHVYDAADVVVPADDTIVLERTRLVGDREYFRSYRRVTYRTELDGAPAEFSAPPGPVADFETDLASVPSLFTWLVPKSGRHLPAALVHDAMVIDADFDQRVLADRVFRDGMGDLDVGLIRRWLMWAAVTLETIRKVGPLRLKITALATLAIVVVCGVLATVNLATDIAVLPWMGSYDGLSGWVREVVFGLGGAVVIPIVLCLAWHPLKIVGLIGGMAIAVLFHVTVLVVAIVVAYRIIEAWPRSLQIAFAALVVGAAAVAFAVGIAAAA